MRTMASEVMSTRRPTALRFAGFACVALGAVIAGVGATREWAAVGFVADVERAADVSVHGTDVWEGKVVLFATVVSLLVLLAMRTSGSTATRRALAIVLIALGALCVALPVVAAVRAEDRFGGVEGVDRIARTLAVELEIPEEVVREQLAELLAQDLRVEIQLGLWLTAFGGVLLVAGGILGLAWVRRGTERRGVAAV
jgi:uncharacterized membrane protein YeiB